MSSTRGLIISFIIANILVTVVVRGYPVFGTKKYGRSVYRPPSWSYSMPTYAIPAAPYHQPMDRLGYMNSYYDTYPDYGEEYYYPGQYPVYYSPINTKYHAAKIPYLYPAPQQLGYGYYGYEEPVDPLDSIQEEILQDEEREARGDALPIGQETWYEGEVPKAQEDESIDDVNAAFLQNLILSQMYDDAVKTSNQKLSQRKNMEGYISGEDLDYLSEPNNDWYSDSKQDRYYQNDYEDDDVKELKSLQNKPKEPKKKLSPNEKKHKPAPANKHLLNNDYAWINWNQKRNSQPQVLNRVANLAFKKQEHSEHGPWGPSQSSLTFSDRKSTTSTKSPVETPKETTTSLPKSGQKEVVLLRPATPVRHPFAEPVMELLSQSYDANTIEKKRSPSVYDTIKQLLDMEERLEKNGVPYNFVDIEQHGNLKKRFISDEDTLTGELNELKKSA